MTVTTGHPDFQAYSLWQGLNLFPAFQQTLTPGVHPSPIFALSQFAASRIRVLPTAGQAVITLNWWLDQAGTQGAGSEKWTVNASVGLDVVIINEAQFVQVTINNTGAGNLTAFTLWAGTNAHAGRIVFPINVNHAVAIGQSVAANASGILRVSWLAIGQVYLYINVHDAAGKMQYFLNTEDEAGNVLSNMAGQIVPVAPFTLSLLTGAEILALHYNNSDGAAPHVQDVSIVVVG